MGKPLVAGYDGTPTGLIVVVGNVVRALRRSRCPVAVVQGGLP
ncbi:hypothetical protein ACI2LF_12425 [Kribbella sp. NPDC020789]